ncbi:RuBisCO chaperone RbcX [Acaryochloris sp. CCMEE 5410]|uniref:RuBisCO chaperone RbcX n=1 Tax=Acaryochloris sp. CCMEE 5410 TaxID=310037 RepID=UPI0002484742|nr:chaperonin family protein RbcX [Acaryochloris sp. CCMEE 5410]KAI9131495.1 chaperonin family protein RbcX [Acaryochloris sp. CCMEE 5410]
MDQKRVAKDTAQVLISYLTYQAAKLVVTQLYETNPGLGIWLSEFSSTDRIQDGEFYLEALMQENRELALRLLTVREHLAEEVVEFLPEMVKTGIQESNVGHRRQLLERMTQMSTPESPSNDDELEADADEELD